MLRELTLLYSDDNPMPAIETAFAVVPEVQSLLHDFDFQQLHETKSSPRSRLWPGSSLLAIGTLTFDLLHACNVKLLFSSCQATFEERVAMREKCKQ